MSPSTWGPQVWCFLHTMAAKIREDRFSTVAPQLFFFIRKICGNLPCPDCSQHANVFLGRINFKKVVCKMDLIKVLFIFHNAVNARKGKIAHSIDNVGNYAGNNLIQSYNQFISAFNTKGNMKLLADSFQRKLIIQEFRKWFLQNLSNFE